MTEADNARRARLEAEFGKPERADAYAALAVLGITHVDPAETAAFAYRDQAAADAWQASTLAHSGVRSLGTYATGTGVIGVYDLRLGAAPRRSRQ